MDSDSDNSMNPFRRSQSPPTQEHLDNNRVSMNPMIVCNFVLFLHQTTIHNYTHIIYVHFLIGIVR